MRRCLGLLVAVALGATGSSAKADDAQPGPVPMAAPMPPPVTTQHLRWNDNWPRFSVFELMLSAAVTARNADLGGILDGPEGATIEGKVPGVDPWGRRLLRGGTASQRAGAKRLSDVGFRVMVLAPYALDVGLGALVLNHNPDVALQLALIDFEVLTLAGMTQLLLSRTIGRARPKTVCPDGDCKGDPYRSFDSGHSMATFAAAGLMCVHHEMLPLYGGGPPDTWACAWGLSVATLTSSLRIVADEHWTSDVMFGAGLGFAYGYFLPKLLHFHTEKVSAPGAARSSSVTWLPTFAGTPEGGTVGVMGTF